MPGGDDQQVRYLIMTLKVLILGGYGSFGGRLAQLLADDRRLTLLIAGRVIDKATALCAALPPGADRQPLTFDRDGDVADQVARIAPNLIVDASGPFQAYGDDPYRVVKAALAQGIDYLDLADGAAFVEGIGQFDAAARARNVLLLSGVSTCPALTAAVVRSLMPGMVRVEAITGGIAPSPYAGIGRNVVAAIASYAGKPAALVRDGRPATGHALTETLRFTIAPPGCLPLGSRRFSLIDVPDLRLLPPLWPGLRSMWFGAGTVPGGLHRLLNAVAWAVRLRLLPSLSPFAGLIYRAMTLLRWGEHRGGMFVVVRGVGPVNETVERSWHLLAEGDDGPFIPSMAAAAIIRKCLDGHRPAAGARAATADLELEDYAPFFRSRDIRTGIRDDTPSDRSAPLYRRILADAWARLPEAIRTMHDLRSNRTAEGRATVERGAGLFARLIAPVIGFPAAGRDVPVRVEFERLGDTEVWRRTFAGRSFVSRQYAGTGRADSMIVERFGIFAFALALVVDGSKLRLVPQGWNCLGIPLPRRLAPTGDTHEHAVDGRFNFHVEIGSPLTGLIVRYRGWLAPTDNAGQP